jgi:hypothetical protein
MFFELISYFGLVISNNAQHHPPRHGDKRITDKFLPLGQQVKSVMI